MKRNPITLITAGILLVIFVSMLFTFQVRQTEVAVITTFGRYSRTVAEPGFEFRLPWPIQKIYEFDNRLHTFERKFDQTLTSDQISLLISVYIGWRITDPRVFLESFNGDMLKAEQTIEPVVRNAKSGVISRHSFGDLVSTNTGVLQFDRIEEEMLAEVQSQLKTSYGITVEALGIKKLGLPESITSAVFERMKAERQRLVASIKSEGDREASDIRAEADALANDILTDANARRIEIEGGAEQKAAEFYKEFEKNPGLAGFLIQLQALEPSLKNNTHLIVGSQTPPFNLLAPSTNASQFVAPGNR